MRRPETPPLARSVVLRGVGLAVAVALSAVGLWLMITTNDTKVGRLGMLAVLWGLLIGAFAMFGSRRSALDDEHDAATPARPGAEVELRSRAAEVERTAETARRREHEQRLEQLLRHEIQSSVAREVGTLRNEIAELRSELLEKVGGQLRLERIETTRVIGSDLEALQHELRELKHAAAREVTDEALHARLTETTSRISRIVEPARVEPARVDPARVEAARIRPAARETIDGAPDIAPARSEPPKPEPVRAETVPRPDPTPRVEPPARPVGSPAPTAGIPSIPPNGTSVPNGEPRPSPAPSGDPLAGLPRIRPFTDFELDPIEDDANYTGRRRRGDEDRDGDGRHSHEDEPEPPGGRRRAPENGNDLLARLLARESAKQ